MELVKIENVNGVLVTTSNRVAEELGVLHKDLLGKIDGYITKFSWAESSAQFYIPSNYKDKSGKSNRNYLITEKGVAQLIGGYSSAVEKAFALNIAYINRFEEMKKELNNQFKVPTSFKEALLIAVEQQEKIELLEIENKIKEQQIAEFEPKKEYLDTILSSEDVMSVSQVGADYGLSGKALNKILHEQSLIRSVGGQWILYTEHMNKGYTKSETTEIIRADGTIKIVLLTKWTQKGRLKIHEILTSIGIKANQDKEREAS